MSASAAPALALWTSSSDAAPRVWRDSFAGRAGRRGRQTVLWTPRVLFNPPPTGRSPSHKKGRVGARLLSRFARQVSLENFPWGVLRRTPPAARPRRPRAAARRLAQLLPNPLIHSHREQREQSSPSSSRGARHMSWSPWVVGARSRRTRGVRRRSPLRRPHVAPTDSSIHPSPAGGGVPRSSQFSRCFS